MVGMGYGSQFALFKEMSERGFNEIDLRAMLDDAVQLHEQTHGTFLVVTTLADRRRSMYSFAPLSQRCLFGCTNERRLADNRMDGEVSDGLGHKED